jgi:zinc protease
MRAVPLTLTLALAAAAAAQQPAKPGLTASQVIDRSIEATGGKRALEKLSSTYAKGTMLFTAQELHGIIERYAKAPNKQLTVTNLEGVGETRQGFDGRVAWAQDPSGRVTELTGIALEETKRDAAFDAPLKWRDHFPKASLAGEASIGGRKAYVIRLATASGKVSTRYYDAGTFLLLRETARFDTPQGAMDITTEFSDYRDVDGIQTPFRIKQVMPMGEVVMTVTELKYNVPIEDALFVKPASR